MEVPEIHIPEINIPVVYYPNFPEPYQPQQTIPGCQYTHRDVNLNPNLLIDDPNGVFPTCPEGEVPHFWPMNYDAEKITVIEDAPLPSQDPPELTDTKKDDIPDIPKEEIEDTFIECPGPNEQRVGDFRNDKKLERVTGHKLSEDGKKCITEYEPTNFIDQYIPAPAAITNAAAIALVAASAPLLLNVVKPIVKNVFKKLTTKKEKKEKEKILSTSERRKAQRKKKT
tara:strand:- start:26 stop:706 length:681 start_codon:yes stop_codon:yes gene_type:complete